MLRNKIVALVLAFVALPAIVAVAGSTTEPVSRMQEGWWKSRHGLLTNQIKQGKADLLFIGDSITQDWASEGKEAWAKHFAGLNAVNMGFGGDRTEHVLWRLENGEIDGVQPEAIVLIIGTNNADINTAEEIGAGVTAIVQKLREKLPDTKLLVLGTFPRNPKVSRVRRRITELNELVAKTADNKMVFYMDCTLGDHRSP